MTLDEAIKHAEEVAKKNERRAESVRNRPISSADFYHEEESCSKCAEEHRQLAEWLKELKAYREQRGDARKEAVEIVEDVCIKREPSVTPQQKMGRWIILKDEYGDVVEAVCSCCDENGNHKWAFCPHCGCKMQEVIE